MSNLTDPWIATKLRSFGLERLHALGVITLFWNRCEYSLFSLFQELVGLPVEECWALCHNLGDVAICERIRTIMALRGFHEETITQVSNALDYYKACNQNRNAVAHAWTRRLETGQMGLARPTKKMTLEDPEPFPSSLPDLRRVAEELEIIAGRLFYLEAILSDSDPKQPLPSRDRLTPPSLLLSPAPPAPKGQKRQPRSSPASRRKAAIARKT